jgi:hypothetical protein
VPGCEALVARGPEEVRGPVPFAVPALEVSFRDPGRRGKTLTDIGLSRIRGADRPLELEGEFLIRKYEGGAVTCGRGDGGWRFLAGPGAACGKGEKMVMRRAVVMVRALPCFMWLMERYA